MSEPVQMLPLLGRFFWLYSLLWAYMDICPSDEEDLQCTLPAREPERTGDVSKFHGHPTYYSHFLYRAVIDANRRQVPSLKDLPVELVTRILEFAAASPGGASTGVALARTSSWIAGLTLPVRLAHVLLRTRKQVVSFHALVSSSDRAAGAVKTLWICDCVENPGVDAPLRTLLPGILRMCTNIRALGCALPPLERLCTSRKPFPAHLLSIDLTLTETMSLRQPPMGSLSKWARLEQRTQGALFLRAITHLWLSAHHYKLADSFPAEHFPHLTHLAIGSKWDWSRQPSNYPAYVREFARSVDSVRKAGATSLQMAVLVFRPPSRHYYGSPLGWESRALVQSARDCGSDGILVYCARGSKKFRQSRFWNKCAAAGEDIWSLALEQMTELMSET